MVLLLLLLLLRLSSRSTLLLLVVVVVVVVIAVDNVNTLNGSIIHYIQVSASVVVTIFHDCGKATWAPVYS